MYCLLEKRVQKTKIISLDNVKLDNLKTTGLPQIPQHSLFRVEKKPCGTTGFQSLVAGEEPRGDGVWFSVLPPRSWAQQPPIQHLCWDCSLSLGIEEDPPE